MPEPASTTFTDGEAYEQFMGRWSRLVGDIFIEWLDTPKGLRWLDVGCGNGAFTERLVDLCKPSEVVGIDPSGAQLEYARKRLASHRAVFQEGNAHNLPYDEGSFDAAAMALVIQFLSEPAKAVAELARVVRPGGLIATYTWDAPGGGMPNQPVIRAIRSLGIAYPFPPSIRHSTRDAMITLWNETGLEEVDATVIRVPIRFADFEEFWAATASGVGPMGKTIEELGPDRREALRARLRDQLAVAADGSVTYEAFANAVKGRVAD
jgi:ubiquinone/menaquinone biosynthesis C-methylase UbiE